MLTVAVLMATRSGRTEDWTSECKRVASVHFVTKIAGGNHVAPKLREWHSESSSDAFLSMSSVVPSD